MNAAHAHLVLNHFPLIGVVFAVGIGAVGLMLSRPTVVRTAFWLIVVSGVFALPTYLSGNAAEDTVEEIVAEESLIDAHEDAGKLAALATGVLGAIALVGLVWFRRRDINRGFASIVLLIALFVGGVLAYAGNLGGKIMHPEIRSEDSVVPVNPHSDELDDD